jgi:hypothetical protein
LKRTVFEGVDHRPERSEKVRSRYFTSKTIPAFQPDQSGLSSSLSSPGSALTLTLYLAYNPSAWIGGMLERMCLSLQLRNLFAKSASNE